MVMKKSLKKANNQRPDYFHRCEKTVESELALKLHALEFLPAPERMLNASWFRTAPVRLVGPRTAHRTVWILPYCPQRGKRKVYEGQRPRSHRIHNFSTSTKTVQGEKNLRNSEKIWASEKLPMRVCPEMVQISLRKTWEKRGKIFSVFGPDAGIRRRRAGPLRSEDVLLRQESCWLRAERPSACKSGIRNVGSLPCRNE